MSAEKPSTLDRISTWPPSPGRSLVAWWSVTIIAVLGAAMVGFGVCEILENSGGGGANETVSRLYVVGWVLAVLCGVGALFAIRRLRGMSRRMEESEQRFRVIADATPAMVWTSRPDGQCDYCNFAWYEFMGDGAQAPLGERWSAAIHPDDLQACRDAYSAAIAEHRDYRWEFRLRRHDGNYRWVLSFGAPREAPDGSFGGYVGMCVDISEQRAGDMKLREAVARYETLAKLAPVGIFQTAADGNCLYVNDRWCEMAGLTQTQAAGDGWVSAVHPDDREDTSREWYDSARHGKESYHEHRFLRADGSFVRLIARSHAMKDSDGNVTGHLGTCTDVTALKEAEEQLRGALHQQAATAGRENLLRRELDHRVRNNLASLLGLIRLSEESSLDRRSTIDRLRAAVRTMNESHELISRAHGEPVGLDMLLRQLLRGAMSRGPDRVAASGSQVFVNPERVNALAMTLQELATNSIKHGALSGPTGRIDIRWHESAEQPGRVRLEWSETGTKAPITTVEGTGLTLIRTLVAIDLEGTTEFEFNDDSMTCVIDFYPSAGVRPAAMSNGAIHS